MRKLISLWLLVVCAGALADAPLQITTNPVNVAWNTSRQSGKAPLYVHASALATLAPTVTATPFRDLEYRWTFGDPAGGATWPTGSNPNGNSKNAARGPVAGHVYETPGTYSLCLTVYDGTGAVTPAQCQPITVTAFADDASTVCVAASSLPAAGELGCPANASVLQQADYAVALAAVQVSSRKRILFKRGDTFETSSSVTNLTTAGPGLVGAYGTGAKPVLKQTTDGASVLVVSTASAINNTPVNDWRFVDLSMDASGGGAYISGLTPGGSTKQVTVLRVDVTNFGLGVGFDPTALDSANHDPSPTVHNQVIYDQIAVVDSTFTQPYSNNSYGLFIGADRMFLAGNTVTMNPGSHSIRLTYATLGLVSNNTLSRFVGVDGANLNLKLHAANTGIYLTGNVTDGSHVVTGVTDTSMMLVGMIVPISGVSGQPTTNYRVVSVDGTAQVTVNKFGTTDPVSGTQVGATLIPDAFSSTTGVVGLALGRGYSRWNVVSDNKLVNNSSNYAVDIGPPNSSSDQRVKDVIYERNWHMDSGPASIGVIVVASTVDVRDNIFDLSGNTLNGSNGVTVTLNGSISPTPTDNRIYHNAFYSSTIPFGDNFSAVTLAATAVGTVVRNNSAYAPATTSPKFLTDAGSGTVTCASCNSNNTQVKGTSPFVDSTPSTPPDYAAAAYAIGAGTSVPVWSDFFLAAQPATRDIGAVAH